jgi:Calcineurin-like phosphoesterase
VLSSFVKTDDCRIHDLFITLGDFFTPSKDINNYFTITVTMNSNTPCNPVVNLLN